MTGISKRIPWVLSECILDLGGCYIILNGLLNNVKIVLIGVYAPDGNQIPYGQEGSEILLFGDFNQDTKLDRSQITTNACVTRASQGVSLRIQDRDIWREKHPADRDYTYQSGCFQIHSRLDMFLGTLMICNKVVSIDIGQRVYSDHSPVIMRWRCIKETARPLRWRLNNDKRLGSVKRRNDGEDMRHFLRTTKVQHMIQRFGRPSKFVFMGRLSS